MRALVSDGEFRAAYCRRLDRARDFRLCAALFSRAGIEYLAPLIEKSLVRDARGQVLVGVDMPTDPYALEILCDFQKRFAKVFEVRRFASSERRFFHPKLSIFAPRRGKSIAIVGSSNLTVGGMTDNVETNVLVDDQVAVRQFSSFFDELFSGGRSKSIDSAWLTRYKRSWRQRKQAIQSLRNTRERIRSLVVRRGTVNTIPNRVKGFRFSCTGRLERWTRIKLQRLIERYGGRLLKRPDSMVHCLIHGDVMGGEKTTQKLRWAKSQGIPRISEEDFVRMLDEEKRLRRRR